MPYTSPSGWVETRPPSIEAPVSTKFHIDRNCAGVQDKAALYQVDRPYSAARCSRCAPA
jgi:hypothetical protein